MIDNGLLGRVEHGFKNAKGCEITGCDWVALARAYGADGMHVARDSEIEAALDAGLSAKGVFVLAARCDPALRAEMAKTSDGIMPPWDRAATSMGAAIIAPSAAPGARPHPFALPLCAHRM